MRMNVRVAHDANYQYRQHDEDAVANTKMSNGVWMIGVFDGHGGADVSNLAAKTLPKILGEGILTPAQIKKGIQLFDATLLKRGYQQQGSTASFVLIDPRDRESITSVNLGDSRTMAFSAGGKLLFSTKDHKPNSAWEVKRIRRLGGFVVKDTDDTYRVNGSLSVSRSLGDWGVGYNRKYEKLVSNLAVVNKIPLKQAKYIVIACDGVTDVLTNPEIGKILAKGASQRLQVSRLASQLVSMAKTQGSTDNITAIVITIA
jgi:adenylate cyclase